MSQTPHDVRTREDQKAQLLERYRAHRNAIAELEARMEFARQELLIRSIDLSRLERALRGMDSGSLDYDFAFESSMGDGLHAAGAGLIQTPSRPVTT